MKALITCGGHGTRLRPLTHTSNKHLIPIANKPMVFYALEAVRDAGIREVGIVISPETGEVIRKALGTGDAWGLRLTYITQDEPRGLAHVVKVSQAFIGKEPFLFYLGDNLLIGGVAPFVQEFIARKPACLLALSRVKDPERFGVPEIADGKIVRVEEKPAHPKSPFAVTGIYLYDHRIFEAVTRISPSARGELEISDAHQYLIDHGYPVLYEEIAGWWKDTGRPEDLLEANRLMLDALPHPGKRKGGGETPLAGSSASGGVDAASDIAGKVIVQEGAVIRRSQIRGPTIIGEKAVIENSYIGPYTSISSDCEVKNSEVEYSIVMEGCRILDADIRIERSLLGKGVEIVKGGQRPRTQKFIVGDQSRIELT